MSQGRKECPLCNTNLSGREILRHIRQKHESAILTGEQLRSLDAKQCQTCRKVLCRSGKGWHACQSSRSQPTQGLSGSRPDLRSGSVPSASTAPRDLGMSMPRSCRTATRVPRAHVRTVASTPSSGRTPVRFYQGQASEPECQPCSSSLNPVFQPEEDTSSESPSRSVSPSHAGLSNQAPPTQEAPAQSPDASAEAQASQHIHYAAQTVPKGCKAAFSEIGAKALNHCVATAESGGEEHQTARQNLILLPSRLLHNTNGSRRRKAKVQANMKKLDKGVIPTPQPMTAPKVRAAEQRAARQVHKQMQNGNITRAARALESAEVADPTPPVVEKLSQLHPHAEPPPDGDYPDTLPVQVNRKTLKQVLKRAPKGSAAGPSGWTFEHMQAIAFGSEAGMDAMVALINAGLAGILPEWEELRASRLVPLIKQGGGIRPIAIGEVWARLMSMCAMAECPEIGPSLAPLQVGVGVRGGAHCLGHAIRAGVMENPDDVTVQLDFKNAFNTLCRTSMLQAVAKRAPQMLQYALWMYKQASPLRLAGAPVDAKQLWSKAGVRQGDPCGPLFFALTLQDALQTASSWNDDVRVIAYLDDVFIQGPKDAVWGAYMDLRDHATQVGLQMQPAKCTVYSPNSSNAADLGEQLGFTVNTGGIVAAGCPIGTPSFVAQEANKCAEKVEALVQTLMDLDLPVQDKLLLLRKSLQVKVSHLSRCADYEHIKDALLKSEQAILQAVLQIIGRQECMLDVDQLLLPLRKGGLGLQCLTANDGLICKAGYLAAAALTQQALAEGPDSLQPFTGESGDMLEQVWEQVSKACMCKGACSCEQQETQSLAEAFDAGFLPGLQHSVSEKLSDRRHESLLRKYEDMTQCADTKEVAQDQLARLISVQHSVATAWFNIMPTKDSWEIDNSTVKSALRFMLGVSPGPPDQTYFRCVCGYRGSDCNHAMTCDKMSGHRTWRHNHVQAAVRHGATTAGCDTSWEPKEGKMKQKEIGDEGYGKRGDVLISMLDDLLMVDTSCVHPGGVTKRGAASKRAGAAAESRDKDKRRHHARDGTPGYTFVPFSVESYGRLGVEADKLLKDLATEAASTGVWEREAFLHWLRKEISLSLIRGNAKIFKRFVGCLIRGVGQHFQQGDEIPALDI